jgi:RHS repeat-associated protein
VPPRNPFRWQGRWYSEVAGGIYDFRNRVWSPELGAFLSPDELGFVSTRGTVWSWPGQNPLRFRDPSGRDGIIELILAALIPSGDTPLPPGETNVVGEMAATTLASGLLLKPLGAAIRALAGESAVTKAAMGAEAAVCAEGGTAAGSAGEAVKVGEYTLTRTVAGKLAERPYLNSPLTLREIMAAGRPIPDPGGVAGALRWDVPGAFRGSAGTWELVVNPQTNTVLHWLFKSTPKAAP